MRASKLTLIPWPFLGNVYVLLLINQFSLFALPEAFFFFICHLSFALYNPNPVTSQQQDLFLRFSNRMLTTECT